MNNVKTKGEKMIAGLPATHKECRYRCFLPDLAGFAIPCCAGPAIKVELNIGGEGEIRTHGTRVHTRSRRAP